MASANRGFTLIELLIVFAIIATLLSFVAPRYFNSVERAREAALKENLNTLRDAVDKYYDDTDRYPNSLEDLVLARYLKKIPLDPITDSNLTWILIPPKDSGKGAIYDIKSGAAGKAITGVPYSEF